LESCANQISCPFFGGIISGSNGQFGEDCLSFCRTCQDYFKLQETAKIYAFFSISQAEMARLTLRLLKVKPPFVIAIDRTEWQLGKSWVNVLMLSISYKAIAIPLFWFVFEEKGCSENAERRAILQQFIDEFGVESIGFVTCER
jgi:hypothetical protein